MPCVRKRSHQIGQKGQPLRLPEKCMDLALIGATEAHLAQKPKFYHQLSMAPGALVAKISNSQPADIPLTPGW